MKHLTGYSLHLLKCTFGFLRDVICGAFLIATLPIWWPLGELIKGYEKFVEEEDRK